MAGDDRWGRDFSMGMPQFQGVAPYAADAYAQGEYFDPSQAMGTIQDMYKTGGFTGPGDIYGAAKDAYTADMTNALNAAGVSGLRGGVGVAQGQDALRRSGAMQGLAGLAGQQAQAQTAWDQGQINQALGYGAAQSGFNQNERQFGHQMGQQAGQFGAQFNADQARQAYELNELAPWEFDAMVRLEGSKQQADRLRAGQPTDPVMAGVGDFGMGGMTNDQYHQYRENTAITPEQWDMLADTRWFGAEQ